MDAPLDPLVELMAFGELAFDVRQPALMRAAIRLCAGCSKTVSPFGV